MKKSKKQSYNTGKNIVITFLLFQIALLIVNMIWFQLPMLVMLLPLWTWILAIVTGKFC